MNPLLQVKLTYSNERNTSPNGFNRNLRSVNTLDVSHIDHLISNLKNVLTYYAGMPKVIDNILIDVSYNNIVAKSNRIRELLRPAEKECNDCVVGARFSDSRSGSENHIITYYVDENAINATIEKLEAARHFVSTKLGGTATSDNFNTPGSTIDYSDCAIYKKTRIRNIIVDASVVDGFSVPNNIITFDKPSYVVNFYHTGLSPSDIFSMLSIDITNDRVSFLGEDSLSVSDDVLSILKEQTPYLVSMISEDLSKVTAKEVEKKIAEPTYIPAPANEPCVGVIDTFFDERVYFSEWVDSTDYVDVIGRSLYDFSIRTHGTEVDSLIVDGPTLNPWLDDGCGRFRVRHFGVCSEKISVPTLMKKVKEIVHNNQDIHVWNLSLGGESEISRNYISYDAAILDEIQQKYNVIIIIAGTNDTEPKAGETKRIGSPADSLNSIVVNSSRRDGTPASYSRKGNVLSFFHKPDISYYGGDYDELLNVVSSGCIHSEYGTSYAAPWISRKLCYLIDVMGFSREIAKALIIDSAAGWEFKKTAYSNQDIMGYGVVPIRIEDVLQSKNEEIRFLLSGTSFTYRTTNYAIPIPKDENGYYPFIARATLCYFPECSRSQGVDYTNRELSIQFGRVKPDGTIADINANVQDGNNIKTDERRSRNEFRKWENTKVISQVEKQNRPQKAYGDLQWGFAITSKERLSSKTGTPINFGAVITLKEINRVNRIQSFIKACELRGWIVKPIDIQHQLNVYQAQQSDIVFG